MITPHIANQVLHVKGIGGYAPGRFYMHLIEAALHADPINRQKLAEGFPEVAAAAVLSESELRKIAMAGAK